MDRTSQKVLTGFMSAENAKLLHNEAVARFGPAMTPVFGQLMANHRHRLQRELLGQHIVRSSGSGDIVLEQIRAANSDFLKNLADYSGCSVTTAAYGVQDNAPTASVDPASMNASCMLERWKSRPGRQVQLRDDSGSTYSVFGNRAGRFRAGDTPIVGGVASGIDFCDQSGEGQNQYYDAWRANIAILNDPTRPLWRDAPIGHVAADEDRKAFTHRYMRSYDQGLPDGSIPSYRRWTHNRNVDRDTDECFDGPQHDFIQRGFDRSGVLARMGAIRAAAPPDRQFSMRDLVNPPAPELPRDGIVFWN